MKPRLALALVPGALLLLLGCQGQPQAASVSPRGAAPAPPLFDHTLFDGILRARVKDGKVDYRAFARDDGDSLQQYLRQLAEADPKRFANADDELAFWLNAYNAFVIAGVLEHYPDVERVTDFPDFFKEKRWRAAGKLLSLDEIENEIIRPKFKDPRIHFILVCAAQSCPALQARAMNPDTLRDDLDRATREAVNDTKYVQSDREAGVVRLTRIMSWYTEDFVEKDGSLKAFLLRYLNEPARSQLEEGDYTIEFMEYDWALNDAGPPPTQ